MARAKFVNKARKDNPVAKKGESYYWWKFRFGGKRYSKTRPKRSQLTQSEHKGNIYDIEDELSGLTIGDISENVLDDFISRIEEVADTCQERLDNMPEQLQDSNSGMVLQGYIEAMENWQSELEAIDLSEADGDFTADAESEWDEDFNSGDDKDEWIADRAEEMKEEKLQELLDVIQDCGSGV